MTATVPDCIAWPLLILMAAIVIARYLVFNTTQYETYLNHCLALLLVSNLLRERAVEDFLASREIMTVTTAQQLSLAVVISACAEFLGFTTLWSGRSITETLRRHDHQRLLAIILAVGLFIAASPARAAGETLERHGGWSSIIAWIFYAFLLVMLGFQILRMSVKEMARLDGERRDRLIAAGGIALGLAMLITCLNAVLLAIFEELDWVHSIDLRLRFHGWIFFVESFGASLVASVPLGLAIYSIAGLDATTRNWRKLQGLRDDMATAIPEIAFDIKVRNRGRGKLKLELHQTTVQVRDAILALRSYFRTLNEPDQRQFLTSHSVPDSQREYALQALQLARAIELKEAGAAPRSFDATTIHSSRSTTLEEETEELVRLAKWWPNAQSDTATTRTPQRMDYRS